MVSPRSVTRSLSASVSLSVLLLFVLERSEETRTEETRRQEKRRGNHGATRVNWGCSLKLLPVLQVETGRTVPGQQAYFPNGPHLAHFNFPLHMKALTQAVAFYLGTSTLCMIETAPRHARSVCLDMERARAAATGVACELGGASSV